MELDALGFHLANASIDQRLFHLEVRDAVTQQPARLAVFFVDVNFVSGACELLRAGEPSWAGPDDGDLFTGGLAEDFRLDPSIDERTIDDRAFDRFDRHGRVGEIQRAGRFARRGAYAAGELGEVIGRVEVARGLLPVAVIDEIVPVGDLIVDGTAVVTIRNATIHAPRGLIPRRFFRQRDNELFVVPDPIRCRRVTPVAPVDLKKTRDLAHLVPNLAVLSLFGSRGRSSTLRPSRGSAPRSSPIFPSPDGTRQGSPS